MKILVVCDVLGEKNNGTVVAALNLINYLKEKGEDVTILCADPSKKGKRGYFVVPNLYLGQLAKHVLEKNGVALARPSRKTSEKALEGVDVCHIMLPFALGRRTLKIARKKHIPVTAGFHCQAENITSHLGVMDDKIINHLIYRNFWKHFYNRVNAIHYPTEFIHSVFEKEIHEKTNAFVISNGVNDVYQYEKIKERAPSLNKGFNILSIGRYCREKSQYLLIDAIALSKHKNEIQLVLAGKGPDKDKIIKQAKEVGIKMPIMKFYTRKELNTVINSCDLYVHPAEIEIEAISCLEAITCGLVPVISNSVRSATNRFAISDMNLFQYNSAQDLANKIDYWIENPDKRKECSKKYLGYTKQFDQTLCMEKMRQMLISVIKK